MNNAVRKKWNEGYIKRDDDESFVSDVSLFFLCFFVSELGSERDSGNKEKQPLSKSERVEMMIIDKVYEAM